MVNPLSLLDGCLGRDGVKIRLCSSVAAAGSFSDCIAAQIQYKVSRKQCFTFASSDPKHKSQAGKRSRIDAERRC